MDAPNTRAELAQDDEPVIDPDRAVIDPHLHLWDIMPAEGGLQEPQTFLLGEAAKTIRDSGHNVTHTIFVECHAMYRQDGPPELRSLGETEFATGVAAMSASGSYGPCRIAHRIVANVDLCLGDNVKPVLYAHRRRAGERLCGVRMNTSYSEAGLFGWPSEPAAERRLVDPAFVAGARVLARMGLSLDAWCLHPQLPQLQELADRAPDLTIVLDHVGTPDLRGRYQGREEEAFAQWQQHIQALAQRPNVKIKLSGFGMDLTGPLQAEVGSGRSESLAHEWRHLVETAIEAFGPTRCMFASNYPPDQSAGSYRAIWNAFKRLAVPYSDTEKNLLFQGTAAETYNIEIAN